MKIDKVWKAIKIASEAHAKDNWGSFPYLTHLALTASYAENASKNSTVKTEDAIIIAWLHDVIEDHPEYQETIEKEFPEFLETLLFLSRKDNETYEEYIQRALNSGKPEVILIKLSDMSANLYNNPPERLKTRYEKHHQTILNAWENIK